MFIAEHSCLLYISTSVWVLRTPNAGRNNKQLNSHLIGAAVWVAQICMVSDGLAGPCTGAVTGYT